MCELLGMECNVPTDIVFSFTGFALRGGKTGPHADGWGVALYDGKFARSFLEPTPACTSVMADFIRANPIKTLLAVAHVRKKTRGPAALENTHPFKRVLWGRHWVFAHNGTLPRIRRRRLRHETPLGETDSEHAFCWMIEELRAAFPGGYPRQPRRLWKVIAELGGALGAEGKFNFLLADGQHLYARCGTKLSHIVRQAPFGRATLRDAELAIDFSAVTGATDRVAVVATEPLTRDEAWQQGTPGTLWVFNRGALAATLPSRGARLDVDQSGTLKGSRAPRDGLSRAKLARAHDQSGTLKGSRTPRDGLSRAKLARAHDQSGTLKGSRTPRDGLSRAKLARAHAIGPLARRRSQARGGAAQ